MSNIHEYINKLMLDHFIKCGYDPDKHYLKRIEKKHGMFIVLMLNKKENKNEK